jgi:dTMP kinase
LYPTLTILIDVPAEIGLGRLQSRDRLEAESNDFHERVRQEYLQIAMMDPERYFVVDGTQPVEEIHRQITERVSELQALKRNTQGTHQGSFHNPLRIATNALTTTATRVGKAGKSATAKKKK